MKDKPTHLIPGTSRGWARVVAVVALVTVVSGCAINRMYEVKQQFCDFEENFDYTLGDRPEFTFINPVIRETDIHKLVGYQPTEISAEGDWMSHRYIVEKLTLDDSLGETFAVNLRYQLIDGKARLQNVQLPSGMERFGDGAELINEAAIAQSAADICNTAITLSLRSAEEDIDPEQLDNLPSRSEVIAMMGQPSWYAEEEGALIYEYYLQGADQGEAAMRMVVWYDDDGVKPLRMETRYREMLTLADFQRGKVKFSYGG
jgi:hypothetical protein